MTNEEKIQSIIDQIAYGGYLAEDSRSCDYCKYCDKRYGNFEKFGHNKKSIQENHKENCLYRLAVELQSDS
jgi:hypothetical protein